MPLRKLDHFTIETANPDKTLRFYCDALGLVNDPARRPELGVPGAWLFADDQALVHVVYVDDDPGPPAGALDHVAFDAVDRDAIASRLDDHGVAYELMEHPSRSFSQLFLRDPHGVLVEINCKS